MMGNVRTASRSSPAWSNGKCLTWNVTVPDIMAASHVEATSTMAGAAADKAASNKKRKYSALQ